MQEMTTAICSASEIGETKQLRDVRDGKYYWVTKLKDNNCWMTQNLDLNLTTAGLTAATSDISSAWNSSSTYPPVRYETSISTSTVSSSITGTRSWDQGMYVIISLDTLGAVITKLTLRPARHNSLQLVRAKPRLIQISIRKMVIKLIPIRNTTLTI
jgi:hypothetical protein